VDPEGALATQSAENAMIGFFVFLLICFTIISVTWDLGLIQRWWKKWW